MDNKQKILEIINNYYGIIEKDYPFVYGPMIDEIDALYHRDCKGCKHWKQYTFPIDGRKFFDCEIVKGHGECKWYYDDYYEEVEK